MVVQQKELRLSGVRMVEMRGTHQVVRIAHGKNAQGIDACAWCGQPIGSEEPAMQTASVDITVGRIVTTAPRSYHIKGGCYDDARAAEAARRPVSNAA